ncbi:Globin family and Globin-like domain and Globin, structural domain-containing protein [Strongyloides ratti]|uniref:Globin family and Globin-like domain and Globin, structural domain-containing protein n=1 Tax=Strongyloides ratti TaxID=34506 RepID=A0A090L4S1_STRRB|nr:Globin family and Globin-like domain and Globin, structural domain-containing protein [Strongyloides ratti]CEF64791.1 Globin family and Globin-like domain and Globin, structural domain-containing protein [Strongyloides ratti]
MSHVRNLFTWLKDKKKKSFTRLKEDSSNNEATSENDISNIIGTKNKHNKSLNRETSSKIDKKHDKNETNIMNMSLYAGNIHTEPSSLTNLDTSNYKSLSTKSLDDKNINKKKRNIMSENYKKNDDKLSKNKNNELKSSCNRGQFKRTSEVYWIPQKEPIIDEIVIDKCKNIFGSGNSVYCSDVKEHTSNIFQISSDVCLRFDNKNQNDSIVSSNKEVNIVVSKKDNTPEEEGSSDTAKRKISQSISDLRIYEVIPIKEERRGSITRIIRRIPSFKKEEIGCDKPTVLAVCFLDKNKIKEGMSNSYHVFMEDPEEMLLSSAKGAMKGQSSKKDGSSIKMPLTPSSSAINVGDKSVSLLKKLRDKSGKNITSKSSSNFQRSESLDEQANISIKEKVEEKGNFMLQSSSIGEKLEEKTQSLKITDSYKEENRSERSGSNISSENLSLKLPKPDSVSSLPKTGSKPNISVEGEEDDVFITPREDNNFIEKEEEKEDSNNIVNEKMNIQDNSSPSPTIQKTNSDLLSSIEEGVPLQEPSTSKSCNTLKVSKTISNGNNILSSTRHSSLTKGLAFETLSCNDDTSTKDLNQKKFFEQMEKRRQSLALRRASNVQLVQSVSGRRTSTTLIPLTLAQIHLIRSLWRQIYVSKGPTVIGQTIFHRFFFRNSANRDQFRRCPLPEGFPNHDSFSKAHCKATADMIDKVVLNLDNLENIAPDLERIGRVHAEVLNGDLSSKMWNTIAETFIDCTLEWGDKRCRSETVRKAWALIIAFMVEKIKLGHLEQRKVLLSMKMRNSQIFSDGQFQ